MPTPPTPRRSPRRQVPPGTSLLGLATLVAAATAALAYPANNAIYCDRLAPLGILAVLAAVLIALGFRALATARSRRLPGVALLLAAVSLFASARFIARYHGACGVVEQRLQQLKRAPGPLPPR